MIQPTNIKYYSSSSFPYAVSKGAYLMGYRSEVEANYARVSRMIKHYKHRLNNTPKSRRTKVRRKIIKYQTILENMYTTYPEYFI